jgi:TPR repeat-containing protein TP_0123
LFLIESFLLAPVLRDERAKIQVTPETFAASLEPYQSGFVLAEELVWRNLYGKSTMQVFYTAMNNYYRFRLAFGSLEDSATIYIQQLEDTAREALRYHDMYASIYAYLCYDAILRKEGTTSDTANGYLSRSFKALQNCMDTMTENAVRDKFIFRNVWNAKLYAAAQKNKLI